MVTHKPIKDIGSKRAFVHVKQRFSVSDSDSTSDWCWKIVTRFQSWNVSGCFRLMWLRPWEQWSHCGYNGQMSRKRRIVQLPSVSFWACGVASKASLNILKLSQGPNLPWLLSLLHHTGAICIHCEVFGEACEGALHETAWPHSQNPAISKCWGCRTVLFFIKQTTTLGRCDSERVDCDVSPWSEWASSAWDWGRLISDWDLLLLQSKVTRFR